MARKPYEPKLANRKLLQLFDELNRDHFGGMICGGIGWRYMALPKEEEGNLSCCAICDFSERFIRVNNVLRDSRVPVWYVRYVVYHEMLHLHMGPQQYDPEGYAYPHNLRFQCLEQQYKYYAKSVEYEVKQLPKIVSSWKRWQEWERSRKK